jgi:hypothetical protein
VGEYTRAKYDDLVGAVYAACGHTGAKEHHSPFQCVEHMSTRIQELQFWYEQHKEDIKECPVK